MGADIHRTGRTTWEALVGKSGIVTSPSVLRAYDDAFVDEVRRSLVGGAAGDLGELIETRNVTVEQVIEAFLRSVEPFSRMMSDVLSMFTHASARHADRSLRLAVEFGAFGAEMAFDLQGFREQVERLVEVVAMRRRRRWTLKEAWGIGEIVGDLQTSRGSGWEPASSHPDIAVWLGSMTPVHSFPPLPFAPAFGISEYDGTLAELWGDFSAFQDSGRALFREYGNIASTDVDGAEFSGWDVSFLKGAASDFWPKHPVEALMRLGTTLVRTPADPAALEASARIRQLLASISSLSVPVKVVERAVEDILNLPIWQRRHELYAVWIFARIVLRFPARLVDVHPVGDKLSFPFSPKRLASIGGDDSDRYELWSELRSEAGPNPIGRVSQVQPDYRLKHPGPAGPALRDDLLVVECKQYKRSSAANFSAALSDYASACATAQVVLVNYGPVGPAVMRRVVPSVASRCRAMGHVRPDGEGLRQFNDLLDAVATAICGPRDAVNWLQDLITVELHWLVPGIDLDLHVTSRDGSCGFPTPEALDEAQFFKDDRGHGNGPFSERIAITPCTSERLHFVVEAYGAGEHVAASGAHVTIRWLGYDGLHRFETVRLNKAAAKTWHVATFERGAETPTIVNLTADGFVPGRSWGPTSILRLGESADD